MFCKLYEGTKNEIHVPNVEIIRVETSASKYTKLAF